MYVHTYVYDTHTQCKYIHSSYSIPGTSKLLLLQCVQVSDMNNAYTDCAEQWLHVVHTCSIRYVNTLMA